MILPIEYYYAWFFSAVVYDEAGCEQKIRNLDRRFKPHFESDAGETFFHGIVLDNKTRDAYPTHRGTDGKTFWDSMRSWGNNIHNVITGDNGIGDGVERLSKMWFDDFKIYFDDYHHFIHCGHSKGADNCQGTALMHCQNQYPHHRISCYTFSGFPIMKDPAASEMQGYIERGELEMVSTVLPGDPAGATLFRSKLGGIDVVAPRELDDMVLIKEPNPINWLTHSPKIITSALINEVISHKKEDPEWEHKIDILYATSEICVN